MSRQGRASTSRLDNQTDELHVFETKTTTTTAMQFTSIIVWCSLPILLILLLIWLYSNTWCWMPLIIYMTWYFVYDTAPFAGGRQSKWIRSMILWRGMRDYFPVSLMVSLGSSGVKERSSESLRRSPRRRVSFKSSSTQNSSSDSVISSMSSFSSSGTEVFVEEIKSRSSEHTVTTTFDPKRNYMFGFHPHGVIGIGAAVNFASEANAVSKLFPNHRISLATLNLHFYIPLWREFIMALGFVSVSRTSISWIASQREGGHGIVVVLGGAEEALDAHPGTYDLTLRKRKGFFKLALQHGVPVVPVFSFGENDVYRQVTSNNGPGTALRRLQRRLMRIFGFSTPFVYGRLWHDESVGPFPRRVPINTVIGTPVDVPERIQYPSLADIDALQHKYIESLVRLYQDHKQVFARERRRSLRIIQ